MVSALVERFSKDYCKCENDLDKRQIVQGVIATVQEGHGRFLRRVNKNQWEPLSTQMTHQKVAFALQYRMRVAKKTQKPASATSPPKPKRVHSSKFQKPHVYPDVDMPEPTPIDEVQHVFYPSLPQPCYGKPLTKTPASLGPTIAWPDQNTIKSKPMTDLTSVIGLDYHSGLADLRVSPTIFEDCWPPPHGQDPSATAPTTVSEGQLLQDESWEEDGVASNNAPEVLASSAASMYQVHNPLLASFLSSCNYPANTEGRRSSMVASIGPLCDD